MVNTYWVLGLAFCLVFARTWAIDYLCTSLNLPANLVVRWRNCTGARNGSCSHRLTRRAFLQPGCRTKKAASLAAWTLECQTLTGMISRAVVKRVLLLHVKCSYFASVARLSFVGSREGQVLNLDSHTCACPTPTRSYALHFRFPRFAGAHPLEVTLKPGDVLFVPNHWWHFVEAVETSLSINVWLEAPGDPEDRCLESITRVLVTSLAGGLDAEASVR